jgi:hypothetical protein
MLRHVKEKRAEQEKSLKEWEAEVNTLDRSSVGNAQNAKITVQNDYDLEGPPRHMTYMNSYKVIHISAKIGRLVVSNIIFGARVHGVNSSSLLNSTFFSPRKALLFPMTHLLDANVQKVNVG